MTARHLLPIALFTLAAASALYTFVYRAVLLSEPMQRRIQDFHRTHFSILGLQGKAREKREEMKRAEREILKPADSPRSESPR